VYYAAPRAPSSGTVRKVSQIRNSPPQEPDLGCGMQHKITPFHKLVVILEAPE